MNVMFKNSAFRSARLFAVLIRRHVAGYHVYLRAGCTKSLEPMKSLVGFSVALSQRFNPLHFLVVFFSAGKKLEQPCLEQFICLGRFFEKFPAPRA
jgi:hypothetical protein